MAKTYTLYVRGIPKDQKNALKRISRKSNLSVNQVMQAMINTQTHNEVEDYKQLSNNKKQKS